VAGVIAPGVPTLPSLQATDGGVTVRGALPAERAEAWNLQRAAFDLPEGGTAPHPGTHDELRVVVRDGRVVSCLTLVHAGLSICGAHLPMAGVRHVATHPEEQNQGYASALLRHTLQVMRQQGLITSVLFPFSFRYYRKFGYELGGNHCHIWCRPNCIPTYGERRDCRPARPADCGALARFYAGRTAAGACALARDLRRWTDVVATETRDSYGGRVLKVLDMAADTPPAWRALVGHLSQAAVDSIEWCASMQDLCASGLMRSPAPLREGFKPRGIVTVRPMFQFRVVDVEAAMARRAATLPAEHYRLALRVRDDLLPENGRPVAVHAAGSRVEVRAARPTDPYLEADIRVFSQMFCGFMSASEAVSQGLARASSPAAEEAADLLFPSGDPFIAELDHF
jgi:predicted acetyltransferase